MRTEEELHDLLDSVLGECSADETAVHYRGHRFLATRFADNAITQNTGGAEEEVTVEACFGSRRASASTNKLERSALAETVARAEDVARSSPEDPEHVALPGPQEYGDRPKRLFEGVERMPPEEVADDVLKVVERAKAQQLTSSGFFQAGSLTRAVANSSGLSAYDGETYVDYSTTVHGANGSGKAAQSQSNRERIDIDRLAETAVDSAAAAQGPVEVDPGDYTVIFEPLAVAGMLGFLTWMLSARDADEGTTVFAEQVGTQLLDESVTIELRVDDPILPAPLYGQDGLAVRPIKWVERGVVKRLYHDRYWAREKGTVADAARLPLFMAGGELETSDLISRCEHGLLVKNLWYIRIVDRKSLVLTGMTRDGVFLVEDGEIVRPVKNLRWNESPITFLKNVQALSRPERISGWGEMMLPAVLSTDFSFTSTTDSI